MYSLCGLGSFRLFTRIALLHQLIASFKQTNLLIAIQLMDAAMSGRADDIRELLEEGANIEDASALVRKHTFFVLLLLVECERFLMRNFHCCAWYSAGRCRIFLPFRPYHQ